MKIQVTYGRGVGETELAAYDAALCDAGIANYNLIPLSSMIPPHSEIVIEKLNENDRNIGNRLYVVLSKCDEVFPGNVAYAGLGWAIREDGAGIFMEGCGGSEAEVREYIRNSLESRSRNRGGGFANIAFKIEGVKCELQPVCAVVAAVYRSEGWY